jgi:hypothetical protein
MIKKKKSCSSNNCLTGHQTESWEHKLYTLYKNHPLATNQTTPNLSFIIRGLYSILPMFQLPLSLLLFVLQGYILCLLNRPYAFYILMKTRTCMHTPRAERNVCALVYFLITHKCIHTVYGSERMKFTTRLPHACKTYNDDNSGDFFPCWILSKITNDRVQLRVITLSQLFRK